MPRAAVEMIQSSTVMGKNYNTRINEHLLLTVNAEAAPPSEAVFVVKRYKHPSNHACSFAEALS